MKTFAHFLTVCAPLLFAACAASANDPEPQAEQQGSLLVSWTFEQRSDPAECKTSQLDTLEIDVTTDDMKTTVGQISSPCNMLKGAVALPAGHYIATGHFIDATGVPRSLDLQTKQFDVAAGDRVNAKLDFSGDAIF